MRVNRLHDAIHFREPKHARPLPPPMPPCPPLRCRTCGEEVFPDGKLRDCRCDRRAKAWLLAFVVVFGALFLVAGIAAVRGAL